MTYQKIDTPKKSTTNYLNNDEFKAALEAYRIRREEMAPEVPQVPEYIGECIVLIAKNLARRPNFGGYSWREDMIGDAIETCLKYVDRFDPGRGTSALAYFSQICWFSFIGRIQKEKHQSRIKRELVRYADLDTFTLQDHDDNGEFAINLQEFLSGIGDDPVPVEAAPKQAKPGALEGFMS